MTMFGSLVQRLTSPVTSPTSPRRRFKSPSRWEVQSDPEDIDSAAPARKSRAKHLLDKRKSKSRSRGLNNNDGPTGSGAAGGTQPVGFSGGGDVAVGWQDVAFPPLRGTKSLGRLDGMKEFIYSNVNET
ncbi:Rho gtpase-activating protein 20-like protein [Vespula squamosa]|uniref:Rho gtpase-activating protein 20-like protein n=1 Tax=Vespula squamosa TaxID=30214 RepID=A0ABD2BMU4_VESSQ